MELGIGKKNYVAIGIIIVNIIYFIFLETHGGSESTMVMLKYGAAFPENIKNGEYVEAEEIELSLRGLWMNQSELRIIKERLKNTILHDKFALSICLAEKRTVEGIVEIGNR